jgi:hypothetical protein
MLLLRPLQLLQQRQLLKHQLLQHQHLPLKHQLQHQHLLLNQQRHLLHLLLKLKQLKQKKHLKQQLNKTAFFSTTKNRAFARFFYIKTYVLLQCSKVNVFHRNLKRF